MREDKKQEAYAAATVADVGRELAEQAWDMISGRKARVGFASDRRCVLEDAGEILIAVRCLEEQAEEITRLREESDRQKTELERTRKEYQKLYSKQFQGPPARTKSAEPKPAATPAAAKKPTRAELAAKAKEYGVPGPTSHREHKWDTAKTPPVCQVCGKVKSNRGRKSHSNPDANIKTATVAGITKADPPSLPLPIAAPAPAGRLTVELVDGRKIDLTDADDFDEGTMRAGR